jgi:hypothetical protein
VQRVDQRLVRGAEVADRQRRRRSGGGVDVVEGNHDLRGKKIERSVE